VAIVAHVHSPPSIGNRITWTRLGAMNTGRIQAGLLMKTLSAALLCRDRAATVRQANPATQPTK
jgi:hypothetical protein